MRRLTILKILLLFSFIVLFKTSFYHSNIENHSEFIGLVNDIKITDYNTTIELKSTERIIVVFDKVINIKPGSKILVKGTLEKPPINKVFNLFNYRNYLKSKKIYFILKADSLEVIENNVNIIYKIRNYVKGRTENLKSGPYIQNFILGRGDIDEEISSSYQKNGTIHLLSISGTHIAVIIMILKKPKYIIPVLVFYLLITGFLISLTRAALFYILIQAKKKLNINIANKEILEIMALIFLNLNPYLIYSISFIFSFTITYFILINSEKEKNKLISMFKVSYIANLAAIPIILTNFFEINIMAPLINMLFIPIFTLLIFPLSVITFFIKELDPILYQLIYYTEVLSIFIAKISPTLIQKPPSLLVITIYYFVLLKFNTKKLLQSGMIILLLFFNSFKINTNRLTFIDVDQGDSILIEIEEKLILVDTGGKYGSYTIAENRIIPYIKSLGYSKLDYLVLTHGDSDHAKDALYILDNFNVTNVILNSGFNNSLEKEIIKKSKNYQQISKGFLTINNTTINFINEQFDDENKDSLIMYFEINNKKILLTGDSTIENEELLLKNYDINNIDILKVGHHGSKTSSSKEFINVINQKYSIIQVGANNRFGHPTPEVLDNLDNSRIFRTDINGSIRFTFNDDIEIEVLKEE